MKNKLINIKNFLRIVISLMVIFAYAKSCAKAAQITTSLLNDVNEKANKVFEYYGYTYRNMFTNGLLYSPNIPKMCIGITASDSPVNSNYMYVFFPDQEPMTTSNNNYTTWAYQIINLSNGYRTQPSGYSINKSIKWKYVYTEFNWSSSTGHNYQANNEYGAEIIFAPLVNISFGHMFSETITYNGEEMQANTLDYNYRIEFVENVVTEDNEITSMQATLGTLNLECQDLGSYWSLKCNNSTQLQYNQIYTLNVQAIVNGNEEEIEEKVVFVPPGTTISGGVITYIPSGDYNFNTENATNQIIENINNLNNALESGNQEIINNINDSSEVENIMTETLSGDIETISSDLGFSALDNPFTSFLFFVLEGVYDVLTEREDIVLSTNYKSLEFNLASTDFITPQSELKTFIRNMLICVYIYGNYKWFHYMITLLETARINKFMAEIGTDEFYDTDIM